MRSILGWLAAFIGGASGWWLGRHVGLGTAVVLSSLGTGAGMYFGYRWFDENLR
ncbi:MAG TPA: hypothetical protein PL152_00155 [Steroidobacteraceae bacterium]|nr:hypothetical protein [Steroidobacteraceae bacterium]